jgi:molybdenum cofactor cytidylyltransferase
MKLSQAFGVRRGDIISFVGAGGKTSTLVRLGQELAEAGWRVLATTTTRIGADQLVMFPAAFTDDADKSTIATALNDHHFVCIYGGLQEDKAVAPPLPFIQAMREMFDADVVLIEADGARRLPLKFPRSHEPVHIPETTLVVSAASLAALGKPLHETHILNAAGIRERYGVADGTPVRSGVVAQILSDTQGGLKNVPSQVRVVTWLNAVPPRGYRLGRARFINRRVLCEPRIEAAALGNTRWSDPVIEARRRVGAVVLAAGMARRMGSMKVLLEWQSGETILAHILEALISARVDEIMVVTGHQAEQVSKIADGCGVKTIHNPYYDAGEMISSLRVGLAAMPDNISAAMVVLGDQPQIKQNVIRQVMTAYAEGKGEIVAPSFEMRRGHPILIDRRFWSEIHNLPDGAAPRDVINAHPESIAYVNVRDDSILRDVDTPQIYAQERRKAGFMD